MKIQVVDVTPKMAHSWLKRNPSNRPMRPAYVKAMAEAMKRGEWAVTHQPIALNGERLVDGQHRLSAVIESGLPSVKMSVAYDVDSKTFDAIDIGLKRSYADIYREDMHIMHPISFIARIIWGMNVTPRELRPVYEKFQAPMKEIVALMNRGTPRFTSAPMKVAALAAILGGESKEYVHSMYKNMVDFKIERLPRVAQIFVKQLTLETGSAGKKIDATQRSQVLVRAWTVFQRKNADLERVMVKDPAP